MIYEINKPHVIVKIIKRKKKSKISSTILYNPTTIESYQTKNLKFHGFSLVNKNPNK